LLKFNLADAHDRTSDVQVNFPLQQPETIPAGFANAEQTVEKDHSAIWRENATQNARNANIAHDHW
jgi:hypothetical protein